MKKLLLVNSILLLFAISCQKDTIEEKYLPSQVIAPGQWQLKRVMIESPPGTGASDITTATFDPCELDDAFEFRSGGVFYCTENVLLCRLNANVFYNMNGGSWALVGDTLLSIGLGFNSQIFKFGKVTERTMELQQTTTNYLGELTRYTFLIAK